MKSKTKTERRQKKQAGAEPKEKPFLQTDDPRAADPGMAFVLVQHLAPNHKSILSELIGRYTRMQVYEKYHLLGSNRSNTNYRSLSRGQDDGVGE